MKIMMLTITAAAALLAGPALAHNHAGKAGAAHAKGHGAAHGAMLKASSPANGSVVRGSPRSLTLSFAHPMTLKSVALTGPDGRTVPVAVKPGRAAAQASVALPARKPGAWRAAYWAAGADGHDMTGLVRFTVR